MPMIAFRGEAATYRILTQRDAGEKSKDYLAWPVDWLKPAPLSGE